MKIVELDAVNALLDADQVVIAAGGGGIPVLEQDNHLKGASAVIEKDLTAGKLAEGVDADQLIILTSVEQVCINLGKDNEEKTGRKSQLHRQKNIWNRDISESTTCSRNSRLPLNL